MRHFYVYIMASKSRVLYTGMTNSIWSRVWDHKNDVNPGFTRDYRLHRLVYYETFQYVDNAIKREKEIKGWLRRKKIALIEAEKSHMGRPQCIVVRWKAGPSLRSG